MGYKTIANILDINGADVVCDKNIFDVTDNDDKYTIRYIHDNIDNSSFSSISSFIGAADSIGTITISKKELNKNCIICCAKDITDFVIDDKTIGVYRYCYYKCSDRTFYFGYTGEDDSSIVFIMVVHTAYKSLILEPITHLAVYRNDLSNNKYIVAEIKNNTNYTDLKINSGANDVVAAYSKRYRQLYDALESYFNKNIPILNFDTFTLTYEKGWYSLTYNLHKISYKSKNTIKEIVYSLITNGYLYKTPPHNLFLSWFKEYTGAKINDIPVEYSTKGNFSYINNIRINMDELLQVLLMTKMYDKADYNKQLREVSKVSLKASSLLSSGLSLVIDQASSDTDVISALDDICKKYDLEKAKSYSTGYNSFSNTNNKLILQCEVKLIGRKKYVNILGTDYRLKPGISVDRVRRVFRTLLSYEYRGAPNVKNYHISMFTDNVIKNKKVSDVVYSKSEDCSIIDGYNGGAIVESFTAWVKLVVRLSSIFGEDIILNGNWRTILDHIPSCYSANDDDDVTDCDSIIGWYNKYLEDVKNASSGSSYDEALRKSMLLMEKTARDLELEPLLHNNKIYGYKVMGSSGKVYAVTILGGVYTLSDSGEPGSYICIDPHGGHNQGTLPGFDYCANMLLVIKNDMKFKKAIYTLRNHVDNN